MLQSKLKPNNFIAFFTRKNLGEPKKFEGTFVNLMDFGVGAFEEVEYMDLNIIMSRLSMIVLAAVSTTDGVDLVISSSFRFVSMGVALQILVALLQSFVDLPLSSCSSASPSCTRFSSA